MGYASLLTKDMNREFPGKNNKEYRNVIFGKNIVDSLQIKKKAILVRFNQVHTVRIK